MANLKDLIVNGMSRFLGNIFLWGGGVKADTVTANKFIGDLEGTAKFSKFQATEFYCDISNFDIGTSYSNSNIISYPIMYPTEIPNLFQNGTLIQDEEFYLIWGGSITYNKYNYYFPSQMSCWYYDQAQNALYLDSTRTGLICHIRELSSVGYGSCSFYYFNIG